MSFQSTPMLLPASAGGHLTFCTPLSRVVALDPVTGAERWAFDPRITISLERPVNCRGLAYWQNTAANAVTATPNVDAALCARRVFIATHDRRLIALDAESGRLCAAFGDKGSVDLHSLDQHSDDAKHSRSRTTHPSPPIVINDVIIVGSGVVDFAQAKAPPGTVRAFDVRSGELRWTFHLLSPRDRHRSGAANVWAPLSVDRERDLVFLPSSSPSPDYYGALRPGNNDFANSVIALRASTGERLWHFQLVHHDLWDYDVPAQPILIDLEIAGKQQPALVQLGKHGLIFVLNRLTGEPLWPIEERAVSQNALPEEQTASTQPFPVRPERLLPDTLVSDDAWGLTPWDKGRCRKLLQATRHQGLFTPVTEQWTLMYPGSLGGPNWGGAGVDPERQLLLVNLSNVASKARLQRRSARVEQDTVTGSVTGSVSMEGYDWRMVMQGTPYDMEVGLLVSPLGIPCNAPPWGKLAALDLRSGEWRWETVLGSVHDMGPLRLPFHLNWGTPNLGGGLITKSGLFFIAATSDRLLRAFDSESGDVLWHTELPVDAMATPMSYMADGRQFVVIAAGGHHMFDAREKGDYVMAFALPTSSGE